MTVNRTMINVLIDAKAMLEHWIKGRKDNWDGSTKGQARATVREIDTVVREAQAGDRLEIAVSLPWAFKIRAMVNGADAGDIGLVVTEREPPHPEEPRYVVHAVNFKSGACWHGEYCHTMAEAMANMHKRCPRYFSGRDS